MVHLFTPSEEGDLDLSSLPSSRLLRIRKRRRILLSLIGLLLVLCSPMLIKKTGKAFTSPSLTSLRVSHPDFVGREGILAELENSLLPKKWSWSSRFPLQIKLLWGPGGMGKSELAVKFANDHWSDFSLIWQFPCETEELLDQGYRTLAQRLGIAADKAIPSNVVKRKVHDYLEEMKTHKPWLLIFDNVEREWIDDELPHRGGAVLLTSRESSVRRNPVEHCPLSLFSIKEATDLLVQVTGEAKSEEMTLLAREVHFSPLLLNKVAHYIRESPTVTVEKYLSILQKKNSLLEVPVSEDRRYAHTLQSIWEVTLEKLREENPLAVDFLEVCSYFAPENIPLEWLERSPLFEGKSDEIIRSLMRFGLIAYHAETEQFDLHRLMRHVVQKLQKEADKQYACAIKLLLDNAPFQMTRQQSWNFEDVWFSHALAASEKRESNQYLPEEQVDLFTKMGEWSFIVGNFLKALKYTELAFEKGSCLDLQTPHFFPLYILKGAAFNQLGKALLAERWIKRAIEIYEELLPELSEEKGRLYAEYSYAQWTLGKYKKSYENASKAVEIYTSIDCSRLLGGALTHKGFILFRLGQNSEAIAEIEKGLAILQRGGEEERLRLASELGIFGCVAAYDGNIEIPAKYLDENMGQAGYPKDHPAQCWRHINRTEMCRTRGEYARGLCFAQKWQQSEYETTNMHRDSYNYSNMGMALLGMGRIEEAIAEGRKALRMMIEMFGEEHLDIPRQQKRLAHALREAGEWKEALSLVESGYAYMKTHFPEGHPIMASICKERGASLLGLGRYEEGLVYCEEALEFWTKVHRREHPQQAKTLQVMGKIYAEMGEQSLALKAHTEALQVAHRVLLKTHPDLKTYSADLVDALSAMDDSMQKKQSKEIALSLLREDLGRFHPLTRKLRRI